MARPKGKAAVEKKANALGALKIEYVSPTSIQPNEYNPNRQSDDEFELLCKSMSEDGFTQPIIVQKDTNQIVDGEHRWRASAALGLKEIPVVFVEMTAEQMRIATLRHNRARGSEDIELSAQVLRDLQELGALDWAQDSLMLDDSEINRLLDDIPAPEALAADDYSESWQPNEHGVGGTEEATTEVQSVETSGGTTEVGMSAEAVQAQRDREKRLAEAKNEEERAMVRADTRVYRLSLIFAGDESDLVRGLLGSSPAVRLVEILQKYKETFPNEVEV